MPIKRHWEYYIDNYNKLEQLRKNVGTNSTKVPEEYPQVRENDKNEASKLLDIKNIQENL